MVSGLTFKSLGIFRVNFCVQGKIVLLLHFFIWDVQFFLQCLLRRHLFPHCIYFCLFVHKLVEHIYELVYIWILYSVPLIYMSFFFFLANTILLWLLWPCKKSLKSESVIPLSFFLLYHNCFGYYDLLWYHTNFDYLSQFCEKHH